MKNLHLLFGLLLLSSSLHAQWSTNTTTTSYYTTNTSYKVGVGTSTPRGKFDVDGSGDIYLADDVNTGTSQSVYLPGHIYISPYNGSNVSYINARRANNSGTTSLQFRTYNAGTLVESMYLAPNGYVGIGTASPGYTLDVNGTARLTGNLAIGNANGTTGTVSIGSSDHVGLAMEAGDTKNAFFSFYEAGSIKNSTYWDGSTDSFKFRNFTSGDFIFSQYTGTETEFLRIKSNGSVGIGTSTPEDKLHIKSTGHTFIKLETPSSAHQSGLAFCPNSALKFFMFNDYATGLKFRATGLDGETDALSRLHLPNGNKNIYMAESGGNVGIGTNAPDAKLTVKGKIHAQEVKVDMLGPIAPPDYVFAENYNLQSLKEVENYIKANKHLPEIPSAKEMEENGLNLKEMNLLLLKKIEELTLHMIEQQKQLEAHQKEIQTLKARKK